MLCAIPPLKGERAAAHEQRGEACLRTLLVHGARAVIFRTRQKRDGSTGLYNLTGRRNVNVAAVALADKDARIAWALFAHAQQYRADYMVPAWSRWLSEDGGSSNEPKPRLPRQSRSAMAPPEGGNSVVGLMRRRALARSLPAAKGLSDELGR